MLSANAYFHLLEHAELEHARTSSNRAMHFTTAALVVSIFVGGYQIMVPTDVRLDATQMEQIKTIAPGKETND